MKLLNGLNYPTRTRLGNNVILPTLIFMHTCDISLFRFEQISQFGISKFPYLTYTSPYFKFLISLFEIKNVFLCLIFLIFRKSKSPYLASQMYHVWFYEKLIINSRFYSADAVERFSIIFENDIIEITQKLIT